jgi:hypothetical protein
MARSPRKRRSGREKANRRALRHGITGPLVDAPNGLPVLVGGKWLVRIGGRLAVLSVDNSLPSPLDLPRGAD